MGTMFFSRWLSDIAGIWLGDGRLHRHPNLLRALLKLKPGPIPLGDGRVAFLLDVGAETPQSVRIAGDWTGWQPAVEARQVDGLPLWMAEVSLPLDAWVGYKWVVDGDWRLDPANPRRVGAGMGLENSLYEAPGFIPPLQLTGAEPAVRGQVIPLGILGKKELPGGRRVRVYLPPQHAKGSPLPTLYILDGDENLYRGRIPDVLDRMAAAGLPIVGVFVDHPGEERHLDHTPYFEGSRIWDTAEFFADSLREAIESRFEVKAERAARIIWGQSFGGTAALGIHHLKAETFGRVAGQSGVYRWPEHEEAVVDWYREPLLDDTRIYLDSTHFGSEPFQSASMAAQLSEIGASHVYHRRGSHHSYEAWRHWLPEMLRYLLR